MVTKNTGTTKSHLLTIAIPVHNGGRDFSRCLDTISCETKVDFHAYIFENASTDGTRAFAEAYAAKDARFSVRSSDQLLPMIDNFRRAINDAGQISKYFCIRAADDYTSDNFLSALVNMLEQNTGAHLAVPRVITTNADGTQREKQFGLSDFILRDLKTSQTRFPAAWYYGVYRTGEATDFLLKTSSEFPYAWGFDRLSVYRIIMDLGAVADNNAIFYCQLGSSSDVLFKPKTVRQALKRRIIYYRILKKMKTFSQNSELRKYLFNSRFAWELAGKHMGATRTELRKLPF